MSTRNTSERRKGLGYACVIAAACMVALAPGGSAQGNDKPYDDKLLRISEILGAVHYLRELCGANEGQAWREKMRELIASEGSTALRRARLIRSFNQGYQGYSRTYKECTPTAKTAISRFMTEGATLAEGLLRSVP
ncbi:MAG: TIGR02301 family protein [Hyphomicrobiaceae bacterium]